MQLTINPFLNTLEVFSEIDGKEFYTSKKFELSDTYYKRCEIIELIHGGENFTVFIHLSRREIEVVMCRGHFPNTVHNTKVPFKLIIELNIEQPYEIR